MTFPFIDAWPRRLFWLCCLLSLGACAQPRPRATAPAAPIIRCPDANQILLLQGQTRDVQALASRAGKAAAAVAYWGCCNSSSPGKPR